MSYKYQCDYCDHTSSLNSVVSHFLANHTDKLVSDNFKPEQTDLLITLIRTEKKGDSYKIFCCLGCNKFWGRENMAQKHSKSCPKKEEHIALYNKLKSMITNKVCTNENVIKLETKVKTLETKIGMLESELKDNEEGKLKYDALSLVLIEHLDRYTREKIGDILSNMQKEYDIDWYSELMTYREAIHEIA